MLHSSAFPAQHAHNFQAQNRLCLVFYLENNNLIIHTIRLLQHHLFTYFQISKSTGLTLYQSLYTTTQGHHNIRATKWNPLITLGMGEHKSLIQFVIFTIENWKTKLTQTGIVSQTTTEHSRPILPKRPTESFKLQA